MKSPRTSAACAFMLVVFVLISCQPGSGHSGAGLTPGGGTPAPAMPTISPTPTPAPIVYVASLEPLADTVGYATLGIGVYTFNESPAWSGKTISAHGKQYPHGLFAHAPSMIEYALDGKYNELHTEILGQPEHVCGDGVVFKILLDDKVAYESEPIASAYPPERVEVDVAGAQDLKLVVDQRAASNCDWSIWGDPFLTPAEHVVVITPTLDPNLPCASASDQSVYLFLDCSDVRRIRQNLQARDPEFLTIWNFDRQVVDDYRANFPTSFVPSDSDDVLWWGGGNYVAQDMAIIYLVQGDPAYATDIRRLLDLVRKHTPRVTSLGNYGANATGGLLTHPKFGSQNFVSLAFAYLAVRDTDLFTADERRDFEDFFIQQGFLAFEVTGRGEVGHIPISSWINRNVPNAAAFIAVTMAAAFPNHPRSRELYDLARPELDWQITNWWHPDGSWGEDTDSYGYRQLDGLLYLAETLKKNMDVDIYEVDYSGKSLRTLCRHYLDVLTPEGVLPAMNDSYHYINDPGPLRLCAFRYADPELAFAADNYRWGLDNAYGRSILDLDMKLGEIAWWGLPPTPQQPDFLSLASAPSGFALLRSGWEHTASYLLVQFTSSIVHPEQSFGTLYLFDGGPWMVANGYHQGAQSTEQHSTITLDGRSQTQTGGALLSHADMDQVGFMSVEGHPYPNSTHARTVLWIKPWHQWLVWDDFGVFDDRSHSLQLRWFVRGDVRSVHDNVWAFSRAAGAPPTLWVAMYAPNPPEFKQVERHYDSQRWTSDAVGVQMNAATTGDLTRLLTSLTSSTTLPQVQRVDEDQGSLITSIREGTAWELAIPYRSGETKVGDFVVNGGSGCARVFADELKGYCLFRGTELTRAGEVLAQASAPMDLEANVEASRISTSAATDVELSFYWPTPVTEVMDGASSLAFQQDGSLVRVTLVAGKHTLTLK